jgi:flagellar biosynthetic protein FlhB
LFTAVAEVMAYVYQLNEAMAAGELPPAPPVDFPVPDGFDPGPPPEG